MVAGVLYRFYGRTKDMPVQPADPLDRALGLLGDLLVVGLFAAAATVLHAPLPEGWWDLPWDYARESQMIVLAAYQFAGLALTGTTLGKRNRGTRVVHKESGAPITVGQAAVRSACTLVLLVPLLNQVFAVLLVVTVLANGLGLHDRLAKTVVIQA